MSLGSAIAVAVAERLERSGGPRAGLVAWKRLAETSSDVGTRAQAILAGLRCALALRDPVSLAPLITRWTTIDRGVWDTQVIVLCKDMLRAGAGFLPLATQLARSEVHRHRTARSLYLYARCLDLAE